jgi:hypothetical protein
MGGENSRLQLAGQLGDWAVEAIRLFKLLTRDALFALVIFVALIGLSAIGSEERGKEF